MGALFHLPPAHRVQRPTLRCPGLSCETLLSKQLVQRLVAAPLFADFLRAANARQELLQQLRRSADAASTAAPRVVVTDDGREFDLLPRDDSTGHLLCPRCSEFAVTTARFGRMRCRACLLPLCSVCHAPHRKGDKCGNSARRRAEMVGFWRAFVKFHL